MGRVDTNATQYHQGLQFQEFDQTDHDQSHHLRHVNSDHVHQNNVDYKKPQVLANNVNMEPQIYPPPPPPQPQPQTPPPPPHLQPQSFPSPQYHYDHQTAAPPQQAAFGFPQQPNVGLRQINCPPQQGFPQPVGRIPAVGVTIPQTPVQNVAQTQEWSSDLFDCMKDPQLAAMTLLFPCVTFGQIAEILDYGTTSCTMSAAIYGAVASFTVYLQFLMSCTYRTKMRSRFGLVETPASDWMVHFLCQPCALCQEYRELRARGFDPAIGWMGNVAKQQQQQNQQLAMAPPMHQRMM